MQLPVLTKREPCIGGFALLITIGVWTYIRINNLSAFDIDLGKVTTQSEVIKFHDTIGENRDELIVSGVLLWIMLPLVMIHIYCMQRIYDRLFERNLVLIDFLKFLYIRSWFVYIYCFMYKYKHTEFTVCYKYRLLKMVIICVIYSPTIIVAAYFDWGIIDDETNTTIYTGYYLQLLCIHYVIILGDAILVASAITGIIPWLTIIIVCWRENEIDFGIDFRSHILPFGCGNNAFCMVLLIVFMILIVFGSTSGMFDFGKTGFYSAYGYSEYLAQITTVSYCCTALWMFWLAVKVDELEEDSIGYKQLDTNNQQELSKLH